MLLKFDFHFQDAKELFVFDSAAYDPFDENALGESGLDHLLGRVIGFWFRPPTVQTCVYLPPNKIDANTETKLQRTLISFCDDLLYENRRERREFIINN